MEVGVGSGYHSEQILAKSHLTRFYMVDNWMMENPGDANQAFREPALAVAAKHPGRCFVVEKKSEKAAKDFNDLSLDWVYIDAMHHDPFAHEDIALWWPKIRHGGMLSGHDYIPCAIHSPVVFHVMLAVEEFFYGLDIPVYVTGATGTTYPERLRAVMKALELKDLGVWAENIPSWYAIKP